jgi:hypothetical protein
METWQIESLPEIIECSAFGSRGYGSSGSWPNITGAKLTGTVDGPFGGNKRYSYTFNNLENKKVSFRLELNGREFEYLIAFEIIKITTK